jgi:pilus assembly protein CpaC
MTMLLSRRFTKRATSIIVLAVAILILCTTSSTANPIVPQNQSARKLQLVVGKSMVFTSSQPIKRISEPHPEIAQTVAISPYQIYITGKAPGITTLILWSNKHDFEIFDLEVAYDVSRLKEKLHELLPDEKDLRITATQDSITLSGRISSAGNLSQALALAEAYAPKSNVHNLLEVGGVHQVMLEVRVAEMARSMIRELGFNFNYIHTGGEFGVSTLGGLTSLTLKEANILTPGPDGQSPLDFFVSPAINALFRFQKGSTDWTGFVDALKTDGLVKILAEPTLIALSGKTANFLAGGEFPVPVPQGLGSVAIEYKPFGVGLSFTPTVLSEKKISINVVPEVSELDFSTAVQFEGFVVPGLTTRRTSTVIELADGQSFAIAGLLRESVRDAIDKFPLLGDIPILGALFRSHKFQKNETELIIIVTPHLVRPIDVAKQTLPTDFYIEPSDTEFYIWGMLEGKEKREESPTPRAELDGEFGHAMPLLK